MPAPVGIAAPEGFKDWKRADQLAWLYSHYGTIEGRQQAVSGNNVQRDPRFRAHNIATAGYVSPEERAAWSMVNPDAGTWAGNALSQAAPYALALGTLATGASALGAFGGAAGATGAAGAGAAGAGSSIASGIGAGVGAGVGAAGGAAAGGVAASGIGAGLGAGLASASTGLGLFANGGSAGLAGVGGGSAGSLAASGGIAGGAGVGGTTAGAFGGLSGLANTVSGVGKPMGWMDYIPSLISAGTAIYGGRQAANAVEQGSERAIASQERMFDLVRGDTAPQRALGAAAVGTLANLHGYNESGQPDFSSFVADPGRNFAIAEGQQAIDRSAAARGGLLSGGAVKQGIRYATGQADQQYSAYYDRLLQAAGLGNTGIGASASAGANAANNIGAASINAGNARASIYGDTAANVNNAAQTGISNYMLSRYLGKAA
jgi:hypothetical protein